MICDKKQTERELLIIYDWSRIRKDQDQSDGTLKTVYRNDYNKRKNVISQTSKRRFKIKDQESKSIQIKN